MVVPSLAAGLLALSASAPAWELENLDVVQWSVQAGFGMGGQLNADAIVDAVRRQEADVLALQVRAQSPRPARHRLRPC